MRNQAVVAKTKKKKSWDDRIFDILCNVFLLAFVIIVFYPLYFILVASFTDPMFVNSGAVLLYPKEFTLLGYEMVFENQKIWMGYMNTIIYTVGGTLLGTICVVLAGYALSRKDLPGRNIIMLLFVFTMYFGGGTIATYLVVRSIGLVNTRLLMIIMGSVSAYNIIIVRSFMSNTIPDELKDAATIDGCGNGRFFAQIVLPLSKAIIAVMVLYIAVKYWNAYFNAMIYLADSTKHPLQLYLREILLMGESLTKGEGDMDPQLYRIMQEAAMMVKYSVIVVATAPILCVYPFVQKYFVKGVMIGSVKG